MEIRQDRTGDRMAELDSSTLEGLFSLTPAQLDRWLDEHQIPVLGVSFLFSLSIKTA
jgi:hypothetical protein